MEMRISAAEAARMIGVRTQTLRKWRCQHKGPGGWVRISATHVTYLLASVEQFLAERAAQTEQRP
jgi:transposase-like protein